MNKQYEGGPGAIPNEELKSQKRRNLIGAAAALVGLGALGVGLSNKIEEDNLEANKSKLDIKDFKQVSMEAATLKRMMMDRNMANISFTDAADISDEMRRTVNFLQSHLDSRFAETAYPTVRDQIVLDKAFTLENLAKLSAAAGLIAKSKTVVAQP